MTYDKLSRVTYESLPGGASNTMAYELVGNLRSLTDGGGKVEYTYDAVNQSAPPRRGRPPAASRCNSTRSTIALRPWRGPSSVAAQRLRRSVGVPGLRPAGWAAVLMSLVERGSADRSSATPVEEARCCAGGRRLRVARRARGEDEVMCLPRPGRDGAPLLGAVAVTRRLCRHGSMVLCRGALSRYVDGCPMCGHRMG